jgi:protein tyrosine/serine phosphatase
MLISLSSKKRHALLALVAILSLAAVSSAQENSTTNVTIKNFGQMDDRFYRGAQPKEKEFKELAQLGIRTIIDLRDDPESYEKPMVESLGMTYVHIPMIAKKYPTQEALDLFFKTINDPNTGKFYVHCAGGRHRTGVIGAVYRFRLYNWDFEQVYKEMKQYDFYPRWGHGAFKDFVEDYYAQIQQQAKGAGK